MKLKPYLWLFLWLFLALLLLACAFGYSVVKNGSIYTITLDSGLKFNATNVSYNAGTKMLNATILAKNLSIKQVVEIDKAIQNLLIRRLAKRIIV